MNFVKRIFGFDISLQIKKHVEPKPITIEKIIKPEDPDYGVTYEVFGIDSDGTFHCYDTFRLEPHKGQIECWWA